MKKELVLNPYENRFSGPCFPCPEGAYLRLTRRELLEAIASYEISPFVWISTSKFYCFIRVLDALLFKNECFENFDNEYRYYNCGSSTGRYVKYWLRIPYKSYNEYIDISKEYYCGLSITEIFNKHALSKIKGA